MSRKSNKKQYRKKHSQRNKTRQRGGFINFNKMKLDMNNIKMNLTSRFSKTRDAIKQGFGNIKGKMCGCNKTMSFGGKKRHRTRKYRRMRKN